MWKRESDKCADGIFMSLWIGGPTVSGRLKETAVENVMRMVWSRTHKPGKPDAIRENLDAIKEHAADLVDKVVAQRRERGAQSAARAVIRSIPAPPSFCAPAIPKRRRPRPAAALRKAVRILSRAR